jgi:hypothetical protein
MLSSATNQTLNLRMGLPGNHPPGLRRFAAGRLSRSSKRPIPILTVLAGALAPTLEPDPAHPGAFNDLLYLEAMYEAGAADYFDGLAVHTPMASPFRRKLKPGPGFAQLPPRGAAARYHGGLTTTRRRIYIHHRVRLERPSPLDNVPCAPAQRIQYTLDGLLAYAEANWPYVEVVALWAFRFPAPTRSYMDYFTHWSRRNLSPNRFIMRFKRIPVTGERMPLTGILKTGFLPLKTRFFSIANDS